MAERNPKKVAADDTDAAEIAKRIRDAGAQEVVTSFDTEKNEYVTVVSMLKPACKGTGATPLEAATSAENAFKVYQAAHPGE